MLYLFSLIVYVTFSCSASTDFEFRKFWWYRYKKLLCTVDLTKDFFFSYSYHVMCSFQKNMCEDVAEKVLYETMFVWNEFLSRGIRNLVKNTFWTVALVYGFFRQVMVGCHIYKYCVWIGVFPWLEYRTSNLCTVLYYVWTKVNLSVNIFLRKMVAYVMALSPMKS